jgi:hypothetical protein
VERLRSYLYALPSIGCFSSGIILAPEAKAYHSQYDEVASIGSHSLSSRYCNRSHRRLFFLRSAEAGRTAAKGFESQDRVITSEVEERRGRSSCRSSYLGQKRSAKPGIHSQPVQNVWYFEPLYVAEVALEGIWKVSRRRIMDLSVQRREARSKV